MDRRAAKLLDQASATLKPESFGKALTLRIAQIRPNLWNPNRQDDETFHKEIASIQRFGFVAPIIVRQMDADIFEIIDGEHRWRAADRLEMREIPAFDIGPISDHEAKQLTLILNELRGKPEEAKLGELLKDLLSSETLDTLTEVLPYTKAEVSKIAKLPEFDWGGFGEKVKQQSSERWVEKLYRMPADAAKVVDEAIVRAKATEGDLKDWQALELIAADFLGGE